MAGAILYVVAFGYAIFYDYNVTKSATLVISTSVLQQLTVLGVIFCFSDGEATTWPSTCGCLTDRITGIGDSP
jgi:hypothetical protein